MPGRRIGAWFCEPVDKVEGVLTIMENKMEKHTKILGILFIVSGVLSIFWGFIIVFVLLGSGFVTSDGDVFAMLSVIAVISSSFLFVTGIPEIIAGWGLLEKKRWSRILAIIMGIINLMDIPFGLALGVYALWVLFNPESKEFLDA